MRDRVHRILNGFLGVLAVFAVVSLVVEYGFDLTPEVAHWLHRVDTGILVGFVVQALIRVLVTTDRWTYIRQHRGEAVVALLIFIYLAFPGLLERGIQVWAPNVAPGALARIYIVASQVLVLATAGVASVRASHRLLHMNIQPSLLLVLSFLFLILTGTGLLMLPRSTVAGGMHWIDALFTATSAVCVTGLIVVDTATYFTPLGQAVLLVLIQLGGLGIMTFTSFFALIGGAPRGLREYTTLRSLLGEESLARIRSTVVAIVLVTFVCEVLGAVALYHFWPEHTASGQGPRWWMAVFHAVSAFCNAGFALLSDNFADAGLARCAPVLWISMGLVIVGGIGFPVIRDLTTWVWARRARRYPYPRLSLHTRLVLLMTLILIVVGAIGLYLLEGTRAFAHFGNPYAPLAALFHSVSARTAGFNTVDIRTLGPAASFLLIGLMWIGASPGSTGGGVKTTTVAVAVMNMYALAQGQERVELFHRQIAPIVVVRAFATVILSFFFIAGMLFLLLITENADFLDLLFELVSAVSTVGLSRGITPDLSPLGKLLTTVAMFFGRVGLLTIVMTLIPARPVRRIDYPQETVLVG